MLGSDKKHKNTECQETHRANPYDNDILKANNSKDPKSNHNGARNSKIIGSEINTQNPKTNLALAFRNIPHRIKQTHILTSLAKTIVLFCTGR